MSDSPQNKTSPEPDTTEKGDSTKQVEETGGERVGVKPANGDTETAEKATVEGADKDGSKEEKDTEEQTGDANPPLPDEPVPPQTEWQAIWSAAHNAYYFCNARTGETTWVNPLDPSASSASTSTPAAQPEAQPSKPEPKEETGEKPPPDLSYLNGIDPELAYLDPTLAVPAAGSKGPVPTFSARFGARDGKFTAMDGRRPEHLSEAARAQRMGAVYYDTEAWEREIAERDAKAKADEAAGLGDKRKRVTKADMERFKEQKKAKKAMRNAWLRE